MTTTHTQVAIVGGGPAGLMLSQLLALEGIESVVIDNRTVETIENTHRAGILEAGSVKLLVDAGVDRVLTDGREHEGIDLRFAGESHRIDFKALVGASCWLYPQTEVFIDLHAARKKAGADLRYGISGTEVLDTTDQARVRYTDAEGQSHEIVADYLVGSDGSRSITRASVKDNTQYFREYPFAWFGVLVQAPASAPELVYTRSEHGFALLSQRTPAVQRMYLQCSPDEDPSRWSDEQIWEQFRLRLAGSDGFVLHEGPVIERSVLPFRSFVQTPMRQGRLFLAGDAGHTVPPTGAKGLNLALSDVALLGPALVDALKGGMSHGIDIYSERALARVWEAQHFSYWMTTMLHSLPGADPFDEQRQLGELRALVRSEHGRALLAEGYTGLRRPK